MPHRSAGSSPAARKAVSACGPVSHVISACASARAALASETSAFVAKPFTPELLTDRVRDLLATAEAKA